MDYNVHFLCLSHTGNCRRKNQDNFACNGQYMKTQGDNMEFPIAGCVSAKERAVFGVFDGLGGEELGEVASLIAAQNAASLTIGGDAVADMLGYCTYTNEAICRYASDNAVSSMGTTAAMLVFTPSEIALCNIGDSKVFRFSGGELEQISHDHVCLSDCLTKPPLLQNLGIPPKEMIIEPYAARGQFTSGDIYLICSDGLTDMATPGEIRKILSETPFDKAAGKLLETALARGGKDNITIILCRLEKKRLLNINIKRGIR